MQLIVPLDQDSEVPIYLQLAGGLKELIISGKLAAGSRMPSTRVLAETLGVARSTVTKAYDELAIQRYLKSHVPLGTFVEWTLPVEVKSEGDGPRLEDIDYRHSGLVLSQYADRIMTSESIESSHLELSPELNYFFPSADELPARKWAEILGASIRHAQQPGRYTSDVFGPKKLRVALADYLRRARGLACTCEQICFFSGAQSALDLVARLVLDQGDVVAVEHPGFSGARRTFASCGAELELVPVDDQGIVVSELAKSGKTARLVFVSPAQHEPSGSVLSSRRRRELLDWADGKNALILEDDFDNEYGYGDAPVPALQSIDRNQRVIFLTSFWKIMYPLFRLGVLVLPRSLVPVVRKAKSLIERDLELVEHTAFAQFISEGHLDKHIRKVRKLYLKRRAALVECLNREMGSICTMAPASRGTNLKVIFTKGVDEEAVFDCASQAKLPMTSTSQYYFENPVSNEVLIPFAHTSAEELDRAVSSFAKLLKRCSGE
jgi:GntR family transcriptional regulator / MocR family aminotransferase